MITMFWKLIAWIVSREMVANRIICYAMQHPYYNLPGYMRRFWVWNPHSIATTVEEGLQPEIDPRNWFYRLLPSIRVHHILRADDDRHPHDHPYNFRTIILRGGYVEKRQDEWHGRSPGDTSSLKVGEYHSIKYVTPGGAWTLFIYGRRRDEWGFLVDGVKVPWRRYYQAARETNVLKFAAEDRRQAVR